MSQSPAPSALLAVERKQHPFSYEPATYGYKFICEVEGCDKPSAGYYDLTCGPLGDFLHHCSDPAHEAAVMAKGAQMDAERKVRDEEREAARIAAVPIRSLNVLAAISCSERPGPAFTSGISLPITPMEWFSIQAALAKSVPSQTGPLEGLTPRTDALKARIEEESKGLPYETVLHKLVGALSVHSRQLERELSIDAHELDERRSFMGTVLQDVYDRAEAAASALADAQRDAERLRAGLQWYADGHHYDLPEWEDCSGESSNWIFPDADTVIGSPSWMVDNGGIAKSVLNGDYVNPNHEDADNIILGPIKNHVEYESLMQRVDDLARVDPAPDTPAGKELMLLVGFVETYEKQLAAARKEGQ